MGVGSGELIQDGQQTTALQVVTELPASNSNCRSDLLRALDGFEANPAVALILRSLELLGENLQIPGIRTVSSDPQFRSDIFLPPGSDDRSGMRHLEVSESAKYVRVRILRGPLSYSGRLGYVKSEQPKPQALKDKRESVTMVIPRDLSKGLRVYLGRGYATLEFSLYPEGGLQILGYKSQPNNRNTTDIQAIGSHFPEVADVIRHGGCFDFESTVGEIIRSALQADFPFMVTDALTPMAQTEGHPEP